DNPETVVDHVRLFRNHPGLFWKYRVHEQILPSLNRTGAKLLFSDVEIHHVGYIDPALRARKQERDFRLLKMDFAENTNDPFILFNLAAIHQERNNHAEALPFIKRSLELSAPQDSIVRKLYAMMANCHRKMGQNKEAVDVCLAGRKLYPDDPEMLHVEAIARDDSGDSAGAESCYRRLLDGRENGNYFASVADGLRGHISRHNLAVLLFKQKRYTEAEVQWRMALTEEPEYLPAKMGLGEMYLERQNYTGMEQMVEQFGDRAEAAVLRGRARLARKEYAAARWELTQAIESFPKHVGLHLILSHALLQEGVDTVAAEQTLRTILELDPNHPNAKQNLEVLLRERQGKR
ncbi:MAG TPA: tetratricopeptide repeat protein, partial [Gemmataceae bacterium]|nr:tetratricopeptide repeat protein [Gemmataceae bacterium]